MIVVADFGLEVDTGTELELVVVERVQTVVAIAAAARAEVADVDGMVRKSLVEIVAAAAVEVEVGDLVERVRTMVGEQVMAAVPGLVAELVLAVAQLGRHTCPAAVGLLVTLYCPYLNLNQEIHFIICSIVIQEQLSDLPEVEGTYLLLEHDARAPSNANNRTTLYLNLKKIYD
jgi:hypothetical protein